jgi:glyoxylase-like metal-dependent hydrolase (beta-lactamase superfamily II)
MSTRWIEVGDRVHVRRHDELDLSLGLIVGDESCLVVDTGGDEVRGAEWAAAVRTVTSLPWTVVLTHAHFDHSFGTRAFRPCPVLAHPRCAHELVEDGAADRAKWAAYYDEQDRPDIAARVRAVTIDVPGHLDGDELVRTRTTRDLGNRTVTIAHFGHGHTDHDLVLRVEDANVVFAGDMVEHGAPPAFAGSFPSTWPTALNGLLELTDPDTTVIPGHGEPIDVAFVAAQRDDIAATAKLAAAVAAGEITPESAVRDSPFPRDATLEAVRMLTTRNRSGR